MNNTNTDKKINKMFSYPRETVINQVIVISLNTHGCKELKIDLS